MKNPVSLHSVGPSERRPVNTTLVRIGSGVSQRRLARTAIVCAGIVAVVGIVALIILLSLVGQWSGTGAVSTGICPPASEPVLVEGKGKWLEEIANFRRKGFECFLGYDGVTPCCARTRDGSRRA